MIKVEAVSKNFKIWKRPSGIVRTILSIFVREYSEKQAVKDLEFTIEAGEIVGFIGKNGAGKSTTIKMLTGILYPDKGKIITNGLSPFKHRKEYVKQIGVVFGQRSQLWWDLPVIDSFEMLKSIYNIPEEIYRENLDYFRSELGLEEFLDQPVRHLSLGQKMRADIAASFLHNPKVVFLDEPTIGLDVVPKEKIKFFIKRVNQKRNVTVFLTSHDLADIEDLCDRCLIMNNGELIYDGTIKKLKSGVKFDKKITIQANKAIEWLYFFEDSSSIIEKKDENVITLYYDSETFPISSLLEKLAKDPHILDFELITLPLEQVIKEVYEKV